MPFLTSKITKQQKFDAAFFFVKTLIWFYLDTLMSYIFHFFFFGSLPRYIVHSWIFFLLPWSRVFVPVTKNAQHLRNGGNPAGRVYFLPLVWQTHFLSHFFSLWVGGKLRRKHVGEWCWYGLVFKASLFSDVYSHIKYWNQSTCTVFFIVFCFSTGAFTSATSDSSSECKSFSIHLQQLNILFILSLSWLWHLNIRPPFLALASMD